MKKPVLKISGLDVVSSNQNTSKTILSKLNLVVNKGDTLGIVGETGSGKTMLGWSIINLLPGGCFLKNGNIKFNGKNTFEVKNLRGKNISMIFQDPMHSLNPTQTIEKQMTDIIKKWRIGEKNSTKDQIDKWIGKVKLDSVFDIMGRYPHQLSGGQIQRVMIALAMCVRPKIIIADEITTGLDANIKLEIMDLLFSLQKETSVALIFISHDLFLVRRYCDRVAIMNSGKIIAEDSTKSIFNKKKYKKIRFSMGVNFSEKKIKKLEGGSSRRIVLAVKGFNKSYGNKINKNHVVKDVSFNLYYGKTLGLVGESGSGKSTIAKMILNILDRDSGQLKLTTDEKTIENLRIPSGEISVVLQDHLGSLNPKMNSFDILLEPLELRGITGEKIIENRIKNMIHDVGLNNNILTRMTHSLSGGQRQRLSLARAMITEPKIIIFDEPTSALDPKIQKRIVGLLKSLQKKKNLTYLFISHDLSVISQISHYVAVLYSGKIIESGLAEKILNYPEQEYTKKLIESSFWMENR